MKKIDDYGEYFIDKIMTSAGDAVRRDLQGQSVSNQEFDQMLEQKAISMIEYLIDYAARNCD